jgi:hypothetical protein
MLVAVLNTYGDTLTLTQAVSGTNTASGQACYGGNTELNSLKAKCYWIPTGSNVTSGSTDPSTSTTGTGQYGYLYDWCAAMNGQAEACQSSTASQPNQQTNGGTSATQYNVCPAGWRLPTGEATTGEFTLLNNAINSGSTSSLYMYSGRWGSGLVLRPGRLRLLLILYGPWCRARPLLVLQQQQRRSGDQQR